ncbi:MAG: phosphate transport regulator [Burkholderiales bacterium]|nr:phosphate transport regulator [Burkholderiales bacterium]
MEKTGAVAELGGSSLLMPSWIKASLAANDRLKLYLTALQAAADHADNPDHTALDLQREMRAADVADEWLHDMPASATRAGSDLFLPDLERLTQRLADDLLTMARPLLAVHHLQHDLSGRVGHWQSWLHSIKGDKLSDDVLTSLTHGRHGRDDSVHVLIMDMHKLINQLASELASDTIDGAHVWQLDDTDRPLVAAFMRGLNRTAPLKLKHPGLDTAATRDESKLLIQNDIGTNDAHVLVMQITGTHISLTYSDLHRLRFAFFQESLEQLGAKWSIIEPHVSGGLNRGEAFFVGTASFDCPNLEAVEQALEGIGSQIVFLIDWNRARKRLQELVDRPVALDVLRTAAKEQVGHRPWLEAGAQRMVYDAMQSLGEGVFRLGDRLDDVMGTEQARLFLVDSMKLATQAALAGKPIALVADEVRLRLARQMQHQPAQFEALQEHASWCHTLALNIRDALAHKHDKDPDKAIELSARAKTWERRADELVVLARDKAQRQSKWKPFLHLLVLSDDVADALEEATFILSLLAEEKQHGLHHDVRDVLTSLADTLLHAVRNHVQAITVASCLGNGSEAIDHEAFLDAIWSVVRAERQCDELLRSARRVAIRTIDGAAELMLVNDLAMTLELASDRLLNSAYALRDMAISQVEASV